MSAPGPRNPEGVPAPHAPSYFAELQAAVRGLRGTEEKPITYESSMGRRVVGGLEAAASFTRIIPKILPPGEILLGEEHPRDRITQEVHILGNKLASLIPEDEFGTRRRGDHSEAIRQFQQGFIGIVEELVNGTTVEGQPTDLPLLSRFAKYGIDQLPEKFQEDLFVTASNGRRHVRNNAEFSFLIKARNIPVAGGIINMILPQDPPLTAQHVLSAFTGEVAVGLVGGAFMSQPKDSPAREQLGNAWDWLFAHRKSFDRDLLALVDGQSVKGYLIKKLIPWFPKIELLMAQTKDYRRFIVHDLPKLMPALLNFLPQEQEHVGGYQHGMEALRMFSR